MPLEKDRVRESIDSYETHKHVSELATVGLLASLAGAGLGAYHNSPAAATAGVGGAFLSGFLKGRSKREQEYNLNKIKRYYDLRDQAYFAGHEKKAYYGSAASVLLSPLSGIPVWKTLATLAGDIVAMPHIAKKELDKSRNIAHAIAKNQIGAPLSAAEKGFVSKGFSAKSWAEWMESKGQPFKYFSRLLGAKRSGAVLGEEAGKILKEVGKYSPRYQQLALDAIPAGGDYQKLVNTVKGDAEVFQKAWGQLSNTRLGKLLGNRGATSGSSLISRYLETPEQALRDVNRYKRTEDAVVAGAAAATLAGAAALVGREIGKHKSKHPLAKDSLPKRLISIDKKKRVLKNPSLPDDFLKRATSAPAVS